MFSILLFLYIKHVPLPKGVRPNSKPTKGLLPVPNNNMRVALEKDQVYAHAEAEMPDYDVNFSTRRLSTMP